MSSLDPQLIGFLVMGLAALVIGIFLNIFKQPSVIAYIFTGIVLGPFGINLIQNPDQITQLGNFGVILLLFFAGMEISLPELISRWRFAILGTILQIFISLCVVFIAGHFLGWTLGRIILMGFVISLSSTAVVLKILEMRNETKSKTGQEAISVLLVQDVAIIPMIIIISLFGGDGIDFKELTLQIIGSIIAIAFVIWLVKKKSVSLPFGERFKNDSELQVLAAFVLCFGIATLSGLFHLSTALGAFIAGLFLSSAKETEWVHHSLQSFRVLFLALFFISIGMLINLQFLWTNILPILVILFLVFFTNTFINALIFRWSGNSWRVSFHGGAILSQIGEFSFILAAIGLGVSIITEFSYQMTVIVIALSLMISPFWIRFFGLFVEKSEKIIKTKRLHR